MAIRIRKWVTFREEILFDGERELDEPLRRAVAVVVHEPLRRPLVGRPRRADRLRRAHGRRADAALPGGAREPVEAYGKGGIVGEHGELEHVAAVPASEVRGADAVAVGGVSILPSVKKRAAMGATLDIPVHHIKAMLVRSHFDAVDDLGARRARRRRTAARPGRDQCRSTARSDRRPGRVRGRGRRGRVALGPADRCERSITFIGADRLRRHRHAARRRRSISSSMDGSRRSARRLSAGDADTVIDAKGTTAIPGLIDSHAHPTSATSRRASGRSISSSRRSTAA